RTHGLTYSAFIAGIKEQDIELNRKTLAELAVNNPEAFGTLVKSIKQ
ncbi:MAG: 50S ribosomal protein L20, partial [Candidatus Neomarinimicrobiota bacterium]